MMLTSYGEYYWHSIGCLESARHVSLFKSGVLVLALSLMAGCAASNQANKTPSFSEINIPPRAALHPAQPQPESLPGTQADRLHARDTIQPHVEGIVSKPFRLEGNRESDATVACASRSSLNVPQATPPSASRWKLVIRSPGTNQPTIRSRDKCNPLWWFGNIDEPIAPDWYRPGKADRNFRYHLRNPCHNFFCYVIGISDKTFRRAGKYPNDNFSPRGGWNVAASNYKYPCLWLPFISYQHRGFQFYFGWRNGGNFGIKLRYSKPTS